MQILSIDNSPFHEIAYENVSPGRQIVPATLQLFRATVDSLPPDLNAILATSDLQGREARSKANGDPRLLGELLAEDIAILSELGELPPLDGVGVILAGDLFARPGMTRRGGSGDVRHIWRAFAKQCRWVAGVAGNHDVFSDKPSVPDFQAFTREPGINFLDGTSVNLDGLRIAGVSGIVGNPRKPFRREEESLADAVLDAVATEPDILVLHDGPDVPAAGLMGWPSIREVLEAGRRQFVIRGHAHWNTPLATLGNGTQVLNVDALAVLLMASDSVASSGS